MREKLTSAFGGLLDSVITALPNVVVGIILVIVGFIVAKLIERGVRSALKKAHFDDLMASLGLDASFRSIGIRQELSSFLSRSLYYLILLVLGQTIAQAMGLVAVADAIGAFFAYFPNIVAALLLMVIGSSLGQFVGNMVTESARESGIDIAPSLGKVVGSGILFVCAMMAIAQLKIDTAIVRIVTSIILGGAALAFGLSFGFGTRDVVRNITAGFYARKVLEVGKPLEIQGHKGVLKAITATHLVLESDGQDIAVANAAVLHAATKQ